MMTLFEQEYAVERYGDEKREEGREEGREKGREEGVEIGEMKKARETAYELQGMGLSVDNIAKAVRVSVKQVQEWLSGSVSVSR